MALSSKISAAEITAQIGDRFVDKYAEAVLINAPGITYVPGVTVDSNFLSQEVVVGTGGYERVVFGWNIDDLSVYSDEGVGLQTKASVFSHDGSATAIEFTHAALVWSTGNPEALESFNIVPFAGNPGTYSNLPTTTDGNGTGLTVQLTISVNDDDPQNIVTEYEWIIDGVGINYAVGDEVLIAPADLVTAGATNQTADGGGQTFIQEVHTNTEAGNLIATAKTTSPVILDGGNEAAFFWDVKTFGFNDATETT